MRRPRTATLLMAGGASVAAVRVARRRRAAISAPPFFAADAPRELRDLGPGVGEIELPIRYHRSDCFMAVFSADLDAVRAMLPSDRLHPVRLSAGRGAVAVVAYNYMETGVGAYGEIGVAALATFDRPAPVLLPALLEGRYPGFGGYVAHLPVTTRVARQAGRMVWGYPKFVADMDFDISPERQHVELSEGGHEVLALSVARRGRVSTDNNPTVTYTELDGELIRTTLPMHTIYQASMGAHAGHLELGNHPVADELRQIDVSLNPVATKSFLVHNAILPVGEAISDAAPRHGFEGSAAGTARHTVRYDDRSIRTITTASSSPGAPDTVGATADSARHAAPSN